MGRKRKAENLSSTAYSAYDKSCFIKKSKTDDTILKVEGRELHVSKTVLALASPVFERMFEAEFKEKYMDEIELTGKKYEDVLEFVKLLHPGSRIPITIRNVFAVLPLAEEYLVDSLKQDCEQCMLQEIDKINSSRKTSIIKSICQFLQYSSLYDVHTVEKKCVGILSKKSLKTIELAEKTHPLPLKSKNAILAKINRDLNKKLTETENTIELKDDMMEMKEYEISDLRRQLDRSNADLQSLKQRLSDQECENRSTGNIKMEFNVSQLPATGQLSDPKKFRSLSWRCKVTKEIKLETTVDEYLGFWACFHPGFPNMETDAIVSFKVLRNNGADFVCYMQKTVFSTKNCTWGYGDRLKWEDFINPDNGYVVDDKATIEMFIQTFEPRFGID